MGRTRLRIAKLDPATDAAPIENEKALEAVPKVRTATVDPDEHIALVEHDGADPAELTAAVRQVGYISVAE